MSTDFSFCPNPCRIMNFLKSYKQKLDWYIGGYIGTKVADSTHDPKVVQEPNVHNVASTSFWPRSEKATTNVKKIMKTQC